ncbi:hypothetical protein [Streptomyces sp. NPDC057686]|uniref:hypothetical protein n=1 Tax=Streptomyces sp. NPDC057686 TaxID=3346212 RepID=UPI0036ADF2FC
MIASDVDRDQVLDDGRGYVLSHYRHDGTNQQWELVDLPADDTLGSQPGADRRHRGNGAAVHARHRTTRA